MARCFPAASFTSLLRWCLSWSPNQPSARTLGQSSQGSDAPAEPQAEPDVLPMAPPPSEPDLEPGPITPVRWPDRTLGQSSQGSDAPADAQAEPDVLPMARPPSEPELESCPNTPERWPENPWTRAVAANPEIVQIVHTAGHWSRVPSQEIVQAMVSSIIQDIISEAVDQKTNRASFKADMQKFAASLDHRRPPQTLFFQYPSGRMVEVFLTSTIYTLHQIQRHSLNPDFRRHRIALMVPGIPEYLDRDQDLRAFLPGIPVLEVVLLA